MLSNLMILFQEEIYVNHHIQHFLPAVLMLQNFDKIKSYVNEILITNNPYLYSFKEIC